MSLISIIVPIYKVNEKYLRQCIESLINQTYLNLEIILVNDGSPDNSPLICDEYKLIDSRIKVIHQSNKGVSVARNQGIEIASGDWITFVDADDWLELDAFEKLINELDKNYLDILIFALKVNINQKEYKNPFWHNSYANINNEEKEELQIQILHKAVSNFSPPFNMVGVAVCKLYKKTFLDEHQIRFEPNLSFSEDGVFNFWALEKARKVMYIDNYSYHYRKHQDSATKQFRQNAELDYLKALIHLENCIKATNKNMRFYKALYYRAILNIFIIANQYYCNNKNDIKRKEKIIGIKRLCNSEPFVDALENITIKQYTKNNSQFQRIGFTLLKFKAYRLFYFINVLRMRFK